MNDEWHAVVREMKRFFREELSTIDDTLGSGGAKDYADYQHHVGTKKGLLKAQSRFEELVEDWNNRE